MTNRQKSNEPILSRHLLSEHFLSAPTEHADSWLEMLTLSMPLVHPEARRRLRRKTTNRSTRSVPEAPPRSTSLQSRKPLCTFPSRWEPLISDRELCSYWHLNWGRRCTPLKLYRGNPGVWDQRKVSHSSFLNTGGFLQMQTHGDPDCYPQPF